VSGNAASKLTVVAALCALAATGCVSMERTYRGEYFLNFESSTLTPESGGAPLCVRSPQLAERLESQGATVRAHVIVRGRLSEQGHYCNLGAYKRLLTVTEILDVSDVRARDD